MINQTSRYLFVYLVCAYISGIMIGRFSSIDIFVFGFIFLFIGLLSQLTFRYKRVDFFIFIALFIVLGAFSYETSRAVVKQNLNITAKRNYGQSVELIGRVVSEIKEYDFHKGVKTTFEFKVFEVRDQYTVKTIDEKILVQIFSKTSLRIGDIVRIKGKLHRPFNFGGKKSKTNTDSPQKQKSSYREYLQNRSIFWICSVKKGNPVNIVRSTNSFWLKRKALGIREKCSNVFDRYLSKNESGIVKAIILGDRAHVPKHVKELFVKTGTIHVLAISGLHVGVVGALFLMVFKFVPINHKYQYALTIMLLIGYVFMTGARASVVRAGIMAVAVLGGYILERNTKSINLLGAAAFGLLLFNPRYLFDVGFQLSFMCVCSIIIFSQIGSMFLKSNNQVRDRIVQTLIVGVGLWVSIAGIIVYYFEIVTPISVGINLIVIPILSMIVSLSFGLLCVALISPILCVAFATCLKIILNIVVGIIASAAHIPYSHFYIKDVNIWQISTYYIIWILVVRFIWVKALKNRINSSMK